MGRLFYINLDFVAQKILLSECRQTFLLCFTAPKGFIFLLLQGRPMQKTVSIQKADKPIREHWAQFGRKVCGGVVLATTMSLTLLGCSRDIPLKLTNEKGKTLETALDYTMSDYSPDLLNTIFSSMRDLSTNKNEGVSTTYCWKDDPAACANDLSASRPLHITVTRRTNGNDSREQIAKGFGALFASVATFSFLPAVVAGTTMDWAPQCNVQATIVAHKPNGEKERFTASYLSKEGACVR